MLAGYNITGEFKIWFHWVYKNEVMKTHQWRIQYYMVSVRLDINEITKKNSLLLGAVSLLNSLYGVSDVNTDKWSHKNRPCWLQYHWRIHNMVSLRLQKKWCCKKICRILSGFSITERIHYMVSCTGFKMTLIPCLTVICCCVLYIAL